MVSLDYSQFCRSNNPATCRMYPNLLTKVRQYEPMEFPNLEDIQSPDNDPFSGSCGQGIKKKNKT